MLKLVGSLATHCSEYAFYPVDKYFDMPVIKNKIINMVMMNFLTFINWNSLPVYPKITAGQMKELHQKRTYKNLCRRKTFALVNYGDIPNKDIHTKPSIIVEISWNY
ncbi:hypothetical protein INT80_14805 [Gallibacterium anatis]|uniref:Uncharacterized protein n=1 Tax=Gallibacterium anatis TaxID=750 RepID=A0A930YAZ6_9PAST|nr:hypothetical protein [Gallibacterium anatis]